MTERLLTVSRGAGGNLAAITSSEQMSWEQLAAMLTASPPQTEDKSSVGWYCCALFDAPWRDNKLLVGRDCLTLDYDHIERSDIPKMQKAFEQYAYAIYTTHSHTIGSPRIRVVLPLSRTCTADEFCAVSRYVAAEAGIELASRESHVPAQCMFMPAVKPGAEFRGSIHAGAFLDADRILATYFDWTDASSWAHRSDGDSTHHGASAERPTDKVGIVGDFCRAFDIPAAIEHFGLPYEPTSNPDRWTYTAGSRPEGAILYDDGQKLHSHHDTDPARGQHNSFDLVRLHRFSGLDVGLPGDCPIGDLPSYRAICQLAKDTPAVQQARIREELEALPDVEPPAEAGTPAGSRIVLARHISDVFANPSVPRWLIPDVLEREVIAVVAAPRGHYKSFLALDWSWRIASEIGPVYVISGEGGDYDRRARAWMMVNGKGMDVPPVYLVEKRLNLNTKEGIEAVRQDCVALGIKPVLIVVDTYSKLSGGLDENDNTAVKAFIGLLDNGFKRPTTGFGATVLLVAHTGHSDAGRPRGASAFAADTDAEYIGNRLDDGSVSFTRERFKASAELTPLTYRPEVVKLGYHDENGNEITSLVLKPSEEIKMPTSKRKRIRGGITSESIYDQVVRLVRTQPRDIKTVISMIADRSAIPGGTDRLRSIGKEIEKLLTHQQLWKTTDGKLSIAPIKAVEVDPSEFDDAVEDFP